jgi:hypothetical protein
MGFGSASIFLLKFIDYLATNSVGIKETFYFRAFVFKSEDSTISRGGGVSDELGAGNVVVVLDDRVLAVHHHTVVVTRQAHFRLLCGL